MLSRYITLIEVFQALRNIVRASNVRANSFHVLRSYERYTKDGKTMGAKPADYDAELFYDRNYEQTGLNIDEFEATYPRLIAEEILANSNGTASNYDIQLTCLDLWHAEQDNSGADNDRNFKVIEEECYRTIVKAIAQLQGFEKRMSPDGTQIAFGHKSQFNTSPYNAWQIVDNMKRVIGSTPQLRMQRLADDLTAATAGSSVTFTVRLTLDPCGVEADYITPCSGGGSSFELDVNGETVTISDNYTLEVLQDGELVGTGVLGENSGTWTIPPCPTPDPVTVSLNGTEVATVEAGEPLALTTTLNGASHPATYTDGVINLTTATPSGYVGLPLDVPAQVGVIINTADVGSAFAGGAFNRAIPTGFIGYQRLDSTDATGATLLYNSRLFGTKRRFTNATGTGDTYSTVNWIDGTGTTRTARCMIDNLYDVCLLLTDDTGRWSVEWPSRLDGATYSGTNIYPVSRGMLDDLVRYDTTFQNHVDAYMSHTGLLYSGEVPSSGTTSVFSLNGNALGTVGRTTALKVLLFHQIP